MSWSYLLLSSSLPPEHVLLDDHAMESLTGSLRTLGKDSSQIQSPSTNLESGSGTCLRLPDMLPLLQKITKALTYKKSKHTIHIVK